MHLLWWAGCHSQHMLTENHSTCASVAVGWLPLTAHVDRKPQLVCICCGWLVAIHSTRPQKTTARVHLLWWAGRHSQHKSTENHRTCAAVVVGWLALTAHVDRKTQHVCICCDGLVAIHGTLPQKKTACVHLLWWA